MHPVLKWILILALITSATVLVIKVIHAQAASPVQSVQVDIAKQTPPPIPSPTQVSEPTPTATPFQRKAAEGFLVLVNWDHPRSSQKRPADLVTLESVFGEGLVSIAGNDNTINATAGAAAKEMFEAARESGIGPYLITSAYRCFSYQEAFYQEARAQNPGYGDDPYTNPVRVLPGNCTEHTTGLAVDILSEDYQNADDAYGDTPEGQWLSENAHKFGFILRYPKNKAHLTGVIYEPWHYRYVGIDAATQMHELGLCLEEYVDVPS